MHSSGWGCCLSILCFVLVTLYAVEKIFIQEQLSSYSVTTINDPDGRITRKSGFNFAFAFTDYSGLNNYLIENPNNFTLLAELEHWSTPKGRLDKVKWSIPVKTHVCTKEELGFGNHPD